MNKIPLLTLLVIAPGLYAQNAEVDIFPDRAVSSDRTQINVTIENPSDQDVFCEYLNNFVIYRTSKTDNNLEEKITLQNLAIPGNFTRTFTGGSEKTKSLRSLGLYPDAYIDVVKNDFLSSQTKCYIKPIEPEKKSQILRAEVNFNSLMKRLEAKESVTLTNGDRYPYVSKWKAAKNGISITITHNHPQYKVNPTWNFQLDSDGSIQEEYTPFIDHQGSTEAAYEKSYPSQSSSGQQRLSWIRSHLDLIAEYDPQLENRDIREMAKGLLDKLTQQPTSDNFESYIVFDGENVPFFASQTWDANNSLVTPTQGGKILSFRLNNKNGWGAAGIPLDKFLYLDMNQYKKIKFRAKSSKPLEIRLFLVDSNQGTASKQIKFQVTNQFKPFSITVDALKGAELDLAQAQDLILATSEPQSETFSIELDDITLTKE